MVIKCEDADKLLAVLNKLELETDVEWNCGGKPTEHLIEPSWYPAYLVIIDNCMTWSDTVTTSMDKMIVISDEDYLEHGFSICSYIPETQSDPVNHPSHYTQGKVECIDAMEQVFGRGAVISFAVLNTWKYLWRRKDKDNEEQDIQKAIRYFDIAKELINR